MQNSSGDLDAGHKRLQTENDDRQKCLVSSCKDLDEPFSPSEEYINSGDEQPEHNWSGHEYALVHSDRDRFFFSTSDYLCKKAKG